ncbi:MAG: HD domain-containing protein [Bacteroidota bacterium]
MRNFKEIEQYIVSILKRDLPNNLFYHGLHHTMDVLASAEIIGKDEKLDENEMLLLKVAVLYHDAGFVTVYRNHEEVGCEMAKSDLPKFGFNEKDIEVICGMIMATKIPQSPKNKLEYIIADADLEYLGTEDFNRIGGTLFEEIKIYLGIESERQWNIIQANFLKNHHYHTDFCKKHREATKQKNLETIEKIVASYD